LPGICLRECAARLGGQCRPAVELRPDRHVGSRQQTRVLERRGVGHGAEGPRHAVVHAHRAVVVEPGAAHRRVDASGA
jgi:hypothetical protein